MEHRSLVSGRVSRQAANLKIGAWPGLWSMTAVSRPRNHQPDNS